MEQYTDSQYDDDLTVGADEYGDTFQTSDIDLFEFADDDESPISRLRQLVLSIDWEITDEVLLQFNEELLDLKDVWAGDKVRMVYLQALEKISRYIYRDKSEAHPNAIKLLLSMYYNLEKIVLSEDLSDGEVKELLKTDVAKFEKLKKLISAVEPVGNESVNANIVAPETNNGQIVSGGEAHDLNDLKAIVLGIDWEITEKDLLELRQEVTRLESKFSDSRPKLVFLQGIGTLGAYIRKKKSNAHADAFSLLHSFYEGLEKVVGTPMSLEEEKAVLFPEVEKFNVFKSVIAPTMAPGADDEDENDDEYVAGTDVTPAFADLAEEDVHGFQEDEEAASLGIESPVQVDQHIDNFFGEDEEEVLAVSDDKPAGGVHTSERDEAEALSDAFFDIDSEIEDAAVEVDKETALQGVDVETEADDDSDEDALPEIAGEVAPALMDSSEQSAFSETALDNVAPEEQLSDEVTGRLDSFFIDQEEKADIEVPAEPEESAFAVPADVALQGVDVEAEGDEDDEEDDGLTDGLVAGAVAGGAVAAIAGFSDEDEAKEAEPPGEEPDEEAVAALFDDAFGLESPGEAPAAVTEAEEGDELEFEDDVVVADELFEDLEDSLDETFDETLTEPVEEEEIATAFADIEDDQPGEGVTEEVAAALEGAEIEDEDEEEVFSEGEVAGQFDALFGEPEEESTEEVVFALDGDEAAEEDFAPALESDVIEDEAEELVSSDILEEIPVEQPASEEFAPALELSDELEDSSDDEEEDVAVGAALTGIAGAGVLLAGSDEDDAEDVEAVAEEQDEDYTEVFTVADTTGDVKEETDAVEEVLEVAEELEETPVLAQLNDCVQALALELDDSVIQGLFAEVNSLRQGWVEKPVQKSYLQLVSVVGQHIDRYRYEASADSHGLLEGLTTNLEATLGEDGDTGRVQEQLMEDTFKVLSWQQEMLNRQAVERDGQLSFINPLRGDAGAETLDQVVLPEDSFADEFAAELESAMADEENENVATDDVLSSDMDDIDSLVADGGEVDEIELEEALNQELEAQQVDVLADGKVTDIVKQEIDSLRKTLQQEIAELRNALKGDSE